MSPDNSKKANDARRAFLQTIPVASAAASSVLGSELCANVAGSDRIKVGLIGAGGRGCGALVNNLMASDRATFVAVADVFADKLDGTGPRGSGLPTVRKQLEKYGRSQQMDVPQSRVFSGLEAYKQVVDESDLVCIAAPPGFRPMHFEYAVSRGKHVFMEKPVCVDARGFNQVIESAAQADAKGLKVVVGLQRHYEDVYLKAFDKVHKDGLLGDLLGGQCYWNSGRPWVIERKEGWSEMEYQLRNWYHFAWLSGDHNVEQHVHNIDVMNWFLSGDKQQGGHPVSAQGSGGRGVNVPPETGQIFDHHFVEYRYDGSMSNAIVNSQARQATGAWRHIGEEIIGTEARLVMHGARSFIEDRNGEILWNYRKPRSGMASPYQIEHDELHRAIVDDIPKNDAIYSARSSLTGVLGRLATYTGQVVEWDKAVKSNFNLMPEDLSLDRNPDAMPDADGSYALPIPGKTELPWA